MSDFVVLTVSMLNRYVKSILDGDSNLQTVYVKGEISNFKAQFSSGHYYMTIKDDKAQIRAAMFKWQNQRLRFTPENGMSVIVRGKVTLYEQGGEYQLVIDDMQPDGAGALAIAFEQLKNKLYKEGLFDEELKKEIPQYPEKVCVITSASGAALQDVINVIGRRYPACELVHIPVSVQGENAAPEIVNALDYANKNKVADVIILGRGGGSIEDLWAFNEEIVARAVFRSEIPVISAVGHETDFTICDFVADLRAPTPSAAAELAVPDINELIGYFKYFGKSAYNLVSGIISEKANIINNYLLLLENRSPEKYIESLSLRCLNSVKLMDTCFKQYINSKNLMLEKYLKILDSYNPAGVLARGYGVISKNNKTISSVKDLKNGDIIDVRLADGNIKCEVSDNG